MPEDGSDEYPPDDDLSPEVVAIMAERLRQCVTGEAEFMTMDEYRARRAARQRPDEESNFVPWEVVQAELGLGPPPLPAPRTQGEVAARMAEQLRQCVEGGVEFTTHVARDQRDGGGSLFMTDAEFRAEHGLEDEDR